MVKYSNSKDSAEALAAEIREAQGVKVHVVQADVIRKHGVGGFS